MPPWHAAIAAPYAHATAPLRRLADRYVLESVVALSAGRPVADEIVAGIAALPDVMAAAEARATKVERAAIDLTEAFVLAGRIGEQFRATVIDRDQRGARIQLADPAVIARLERSRAEPGDQLEVRLVGADRATRRVTFEPTT